MLGFLAAGVPVAVGELAHAGAVLGQPVWMAVAAGGLTAGAAALLIWSQRRLRGAERRALAARLDSLVGEVTTGRYGSRIAANLDKLAARDVLSLELNRERRFLQSVLGRIPEPVLVLDGNGVVVLANDMLRAMVGEGRAEGASLEQLVGARQPAWYKRLRAQGEVDGEEVQIITEGGSVPVLLSAARLAEGGSAVLICREAGKAAELALELRAVHTRLADSERFFQNLFDAMDDPITVLAPDGEVLQANRAARALFGQDVVGGRCYRRFRMRDTVCASCPAKETYDRLSSTSVEHRVFGNAVTRISTYPLLGDQGELRAIINHKRDVTKERQLEDLKAHFLAAVSHELRTPLTSLMGFNKLNLRRLTRYVVPAMETAPHKVRVAVQKILEDMQVMDSEAARLGRLVNDVLDLSKLEAGKLRLQMAEIEVGPLVQGALVATSTLWRDRPLRVTAEVPSSCPLAWADGDRISQVLVNLLSNAAKFTQRGRIIARVVVEEEALRVEVEDTGPGIEPDELPQVFEKFRQLQGEAGLIEVRGTGLGLPISRELIRLHGGRLWVDSEVGVGSTFRFTLPRADAVGEAARRALGRPRLRHL